MSKNKKFLMAGLGLAALGVAGGITAYVLIKKRKNKTPDDPEPKPKPNPPGPKPEPKPPGPGPVPDPDPVVPPEPPVKIAYAYDGFENVRARSEGSHTVTGGTWWSCQDACDKDPNCTGYTVTTNTAIAPEGSCITSTLDPMTAEIMPEGQGQTFYVRRLATDPAAVWGEWNPKSCPSGPEASCSGPKERTRRCTTSTCPGPTVSKCPGTLCDWFEEMPNLFALTGPDAQRENEISVTRSADTVGGKEACKAACLGNLDCRAYIYEDLTDDPDWKAAKKRDASLLPTTCSLMGKGWYPTATVNMSKYTLPGTLRYWGRRMADGSKWAPIDPANCVSGPRQCLSGAGTCKDGISTVSC